jgi:hypothetical protein
MPGFSTIRKCWMDWRNSREVRDLNHQYRLFDMFTGRNGYLNLPGFVGVP